MSYIGAIIRNPDMNDSQRATVERLVRSFGAPFSFSVVACSALATWQNIGTVSVRSDGQARKLSDGETI